MKIAIVGLGLIGGSMAKSIKAKTAHPVDGAALVREGRELKATAGGN